MPSVCLACCGRAQRMSNDHWACARRTLRVLSTYLYRMGDERGAPHYSHKHSVGATYAARPLSEWGACCCVQNVPITLLQRMVNVCIAFWVRWANAKLFEHAQNLSVRQRSSSIRQRSLSIPRTYSTYAQREHTLSIRRLFFVHVTGALTSTYVSKPRREICNTL